MSSHTRSRLAIVAALAALSVAGCEKADDVAVELDSAEFPKSVDDKPILKVRGTGSGTKKALRLQPKQGLEQQLTFDIKGGMSGMKMDMTMVMDSKVTRVRPDGTFDVSASFADLKMRGPQAAGDAGDMVKEMMKDMGMTWTFTERGDLEAQKVTGGLAGLVDQGFAQLFLSLPKEPIGVGASWVVNDVISNQGMTVRQQLRYKVKKIDGNRVELDMGVTQRAGAQDLGMAQLDKLESSGKGTLIIDTSKALPQRMKLDLKVAVTVKVGGKTDTQDTRFEFDWTSK
jgi:hypothetical protein